MTNVKIRTVAPSGDSPARDARFVIRPSDFLRISDFELRHSGFTLIELMLSVAIVALLSVSVAGLVHYGRLQAGIRVSTGNLRQLVVANLSYAADNAGYFCPAQEPRNLKRWHGGRKSVEDPFEADQGFLTPYLGGDQRLETCPLLKKALEGKESFEDGSGGYGYNAAYVGGCPANGFAPIQLLDVPVPSRTMMFATTALSRAEGVQEYPFAEPPFAPTGDGSRGQDLQPSVHFRAGGKALVAWCDGRISQEIPAAFKNINYYGGNNKRDQIGWFGPDEENGFWNPDSPAALKNWTPRREEKPGPKTAPE